MQIMLTIKDFIELSWGRVHHKVSCNSDLEINTTCVNENIKRSKAQIQCVTYWFISPLAQRNCVVEQKKNTDASLLVQFIRF